MTELELKYGFPMFTKQSNTVYLGDSKKLIISDVWAFWDYVIKKQEKKRNFYVALLEQAKHFYVAAEASPVKSKPLLYYYSFLNFAKILIGIEKGYSETSDYRHGLSEKNNGAFSRSEIVVFGKGEHVKNVSIELMEMFETEITSANRVIRVKELLAHCVGVHRTYSEIYNQRESFYRLENVRLYKDGLKIMFKADVMCSARTVDGLRDVGYTIDSEKGKFAFVQVMDTKCNQKSRKDYFDLAQKIRKCGIWYYIGNDGYTCYLSDCKNNRFSPETIIYNTMFYLGSITRYHPYMFDKIFSNKEQWLMSEFLTTQPKQFLFLATAKFLGQPVLKAYSSF